MSDANEEKEPNNAKRGREVEKAVPTQKEVSVITERHQRQSHSKRLPIFYIIVGTFEHSLASLLNLIRCVSRERKERERTRDAFRVFSRKDTFLTFLLRFDRKRADRGKFFALLSFALFGGVKAHSSSSRLLILLLLLLLLCVCACVFCSVKLSSQRVFFPPKIEKKRSFDSNNTKKNGERTIQRAEEEVGEGERRA